MNRKNLRVLVITLMMTIMMAVPSYAEEIDKIAQANSLKLGIITIIPPLLAIVLAFITRNVVISLFLGVMSGSLILQLSGGSGIVSGIVLAFLDFISRALKSLADPWNAGIVLQVLCIGGVINLVGKMGGAKAVAESLARRAKSAKGAQTISWFLGILVFTNCWSNNEAGL